MAAEAQLAVLIERNASLFSAYEDWANSQTKLLAGSIDDPESFNAQGGKTGTLGYYPVVNASGQTIYVPSLARLLAIAAGAGDIGAIEAVLSGAVAARQGAEAAKAGTQELANLFAGDVIDLQSKIRNIAFEGELFDLNDIPALALGNFVLGRVVNGKLEFIPFGPETLARMGVDAIETTQLLDPTFVPLVIIDGKVVVWLNNGKLEFAPFGPETLAALAAELGSGPAPAPSLPPIAPGDADRGRYMQRFNAKLALAAAGLGQAHVVVSGDSHTENPTGPQREANRFYAIYGKAGEGWQSARGANSNTLNGLTNRLTDATGGNGSWTVLDISSSVNPAPTRRYGLDGFVSFTNTPGDRWAIGNAQFDKAWLFYDQAVVGSFKYSLNGGASWSAPVASLGVNGLGVIAIDDPSDDPRLLMVEHISGDYARLGEFLKSNRSGFIYSKAGNSGCTALQLASVSLYMTDIAAVIEPDLLIVRLGTNDSTSDFDSTTGTFVAKTKQIVDAVRTGAPRCEVLLSHPAAHGGGVKRPQAEFAAAWRALALEQGYEFMNMLPAMGPYSMTGPSGLNLWADPTHLNGNGWTVFVDTEFRYYFGRF